ncbi:ATP-binding protein [Haliscomenobacter sp.]|uniref:sensor histidine kinase n=1 Tax=Haliscomenobacter sp. TaxID=2717303 RepID=UPI003364D962
MKTIKQIAQQHSWIIRYCLILLLFCLKAWPIQAQSIGESQYFGQIIRSNALKLDSIWDYCPQEDTTNATWQSINTLTLNAPNGKPFPWKGRGWFRKSFTVPFALRNRPLYFQMVHWGASEIYLDGVKLASYGKLGNTRAEEHTFVPFECISFMPDTQPVHHWVVHYSNHHINLPGTPSAFNGFELGVSPHPIPYRERMIQNATGAMSISFCLGFGLFFFFVFWFYPQRLASLMAAAWLLHFSLIFIPLQLFPLNGDGEFSRLCNLTWQISVGTINGSVVLFYYALYYGKFPPRSWFVVGLNVLIIFALCTFPETGKYVFFISSLLQVEIFRMLILGYKKDRNKFWVLAIGQPLSLLLFLFVIVNIFGTFPEDRITTGRFIFNILSDLCIPIMLALQLAWEFGSANRVLQKQVVQVNELMEENLNKEQEKQQILATQNETLEHQVAERTEALNHSLETLKATQAQLIQSEKLASLGELTAGIAHEIQNPLNFVNNFAEVSAEMLDEMEEELDKGDTQEAKAIAADLQKNLQKINHHGQRASSIVKGMLEHSRSSSGVKEPTNLNALADEYLRLAYHGLRAKDSSFNATMETHFDPDLPHVEVIPQDIGRVLLNLINNAFYAVAERSRSAVAERSRSTVNQRDKAIETLHATSLPYQPTVTITTRKLENAIEIRVQDNGNGIPDAIKDKIFQPFFTTKPTGQGTGLGLSLAYDIVTKGHGGTLEMDSKDNIGSTFIISLPMRTT